MEKYLNKLFSLVDKREWDIKVYFKFYISIVVLIYNGNKRFIYEGDVFFRMIFYFLFWLVRFGTMIRYLGRDVVYVVRVVILIVKVKLWVLIVLLLWV